MSEIEGLPDGLAEYVEQRQRDVPVDRSRLCPCVGEDLKPDPECTVCRGTGLPVVEVTVGFPANRPEFVHESFVANRPHDARSCPICTGRRPA